MKVFLILIFVLLACCNVKQFLIVADQLVNVLCFGWADETLSARCGREKRWLRHVIDVIFCWQRDEAGRGHCEQCYWYERERMDLPGEYRE
jgi:uncharacterized membrane protein